MPELRKPTVVIPADFPTQISDSPQLERLRQASDLRVFRTALSSVEEQLDRTRDAEIVINSRGQVTWPEPLLAELSKLRMITTCSIGTDSIDLEAAARRGIVVSNIPGRTAKVVAEHTLALMLATAKRLAWQTSELKRGRWTAMQNVMLAGKTLGIVGTGAIGSQVARLGRAIGMRVIAWTLHPNHEKAAQLDLQYVELDELLESSDVVSLHLRLTNQSRQLIGSSQLKRMRPGSLLINTARSAIVDNQALAKLLHEGHLGGAGLDVFDTEPIDPHDPLLECEQIVLSPHHADQTPEGKELLNEGAVNNVLAFLDGSPQNVVS